MTERQKNILKAMEAVKKGASVSAAARKFSIPRSTLNDKICGYSPALCSKGPATVLSKEEEDNLKRWIIFMANSGFPVTKAQLLDSVSILVKKSKRDNPFQNGRPGRHWFEAFIKRHPEVAQRVAQKTQTPATVQESDVRLWFKEVKDYFLQANLEEAAHDPRRIFNCHECVFSLSPSEYKVLEKRCAKNAYDVLTSSEKDGVTVLVTANAAGELAPPMVAFKLKSVPHKISKTALKERGFGVTTKDCITGELFFEYMTSVFFPWIEKRNIPLPIIFFLDGHCLYTTLPLSNFCKEKNIQLVALYPNTNHLLQPMDEVFKPLKRIWKREINNWRNDNQFGKLGKEHFHPLLYKTLQQLDPKLIKNGFRKCGLSPFDANYVDYSKCVMSHINKPAKPDNVNQIQSDAVSHLKYFESQISPENLEAFYACKTPTWKGDKSLEGLFDVWRKMHIQNNLSLDKFNNDSTSKINKCTLIGGIGSFVGLSDNLDSNLLNSKEFNDLRTQNERLKGKVDMMKESENFNGTPMKIVDMEIPVNENSLTELDKVEKSHLSGQVIQRQKFEEIYIETPPHTSIMNLSEDDSSRSSYLTSLDNTCLPNAEPKLERKSLEDINMKTPPHTFIINLLENDSSRSRYFSCLKQASLPNAEKIFQSKSRKEINMNSPIMKLPEDNSDKPKHNGDLFVPTVKDTFFWRRTPSNSTRSKIKLSRVITSDRMQIFEQKEKEVKTKKGKKRKDKKPRKSVHE